MTEVATQTIQLPEFENKVLGKRFTNNTWEFEAIQGAQKAKDPIQYKLDEIRRNQDIDEVHQRCDVLASRLNKMERTIGEIKNLVEEMKMTNDSLTLATEHQICKLERHFEGEIIDLQGQIDSIQS